MPTWKVGDRVRVIAREQSAKDAQENAYFPHMADLEGTVSKVYSPEEICVMVDRDTLPEQNAERHAEIETRLQERWLDSISQEARANLSEPEQKFTLHYTLLVKAADLETAKGKRTPKPRDERPHTKDLDAVEEEFLNKRTQLR
jgi:hypothetical protein